MNDLHQQIKEALATIREEWEVYEYPQGGYEIYEKESRAIIFQSFPTEANGKFNGSIIVDFPKWLQYLLDELWKVREERDSHQRVCMNVMTENAAMKEALEWYGDEKTYKLGVNIKMGTAFPLHEPIKSDKGERARNVLSTLSKEEPE